MILNGGAAGMEVYRTNEANEAGLDQQPASACRQCGIRHDTVPAAAIRILIEKVDAVLRIAYPSPIPPMMQ
jgi:hypothetical protein